MKKRKKNVSEDQQSNTRSLTPGREYSDLPVELLIDIFLRVSSKAIARLRCLSKIWSSILGRQDFTELFLTKSLTRPRLLFAFEVGGKLFFTSSLQTPNRDNTSCLVSVDHQSYYPTGYSREYHHLNGLICRQDETRPQLAVICHPSTGESLTLPEVSSTGSYFIGYDPVVQQYKVLCVTWYDSSLPQEHQVLTLGNAKHLWRKFKLCRPQYPLNKKICINGVLYYLSYITLSSRATMIVCFDVKSELFSFINVDAEKHDWLYHRYEIPYTFINYKGKLGLVHLKGFCDRVLELLVLEDAGKHKWSHQTFKFCIWRSLCATTDLHVIGMTGTRDIVLSTRFLSDPHYVYYYNLDRKTLTRSEIRGFNKEFQKLRVYIFQDYAENLKLSLCNV